MDGSLETRLRGSKTIWLRAAYDVLVDQGVGSVKVMPLAKHLGLTRTGFYWHFKDRDALLDAIIACWEAKNTGNLIARTQAYAETICEAMFNLFDCWLDDELFDAKLDLAIRNWARTDAALQARLDIADRNRRDALIKMFIRFGFEPELAKVRALSILYTQIGYISMQIIEPQETRIKQMPDYISVFAGQQPTQSEIGRFQARHLP